MSQIKQLQMTFVPVEDRILFRVNIADRTISQIRFWITRRYVKVLWKALLNMLESRKGSTESQKAQPDHQAQSGSMDLEHKKAVADADFETSFQENAVFPLGEAPILLSRVGVRNSAEGGQMIRLDPLKGNGIEFTLNDKMLHSICKLVADTAQKAEWDLQLDFAKAQQLLEPGGLN